MRILGLDPGLRHTGWGVIEVDGNRLTPIGSGAVSTDGARTLADRLVEIHDGLSAIVADFSPEEAAVEETFVNKNPVSTLKLGQARGIALLVPALAGVGVFEYAPNKIKKAVVGAGHADKRQIHAMIGVLLAGCPIPNDHAADALAAAICHAHNRGRHGLERALARAGGGAAS